MLITENDVLSLEDLCTASGFNMAEIRAVCPNGTTYSMTRGVDGWLPKTLKELESIDTEAMGGEYNVIR